MVEPRRERRPVAAVMATEALVPPPDVARRVELALAMIDMGAAVFPLAPGSKAPLIPKRKGGGGFLDASPDPEAARTFLSHAGHPNYGVVFPEGSDVIVLDLDGGDRDKRPGWQADWQRLYERLGPPGLTFIVRTPSGGRHAYYRWRTDRYGPIPPGDEMLGWTVRKPAKGYLVGPGSVVNGATYEPVGAPAIADLPQAWVHAAIAEKSTRHDDVIRVAGSTQAVEVGVGHRHAYLRDRARHLRGVGLTGEALFAAVMDLNSQLPEPKSADDVRRAIGDVEAKFDPDPIDPETGRPIVAAQTRAAVGRTNTEPPKVLDALPFYTAAEIAAMTPEVIDWAWRDYLAHGTILELVGPPKAGKTTLVLGLLRALVHGHPFLDRPTAAGPVVVLTEQGPTSLRAVLVRTELAERDDVHLLLHRDARGHRWRDVVATATAYCDKVRARVLVVDTLPAFAGLAGESENNAGDALEAMEPLLAAASNGLAVLVNRHRRKGAQGGSLAGDIADEGRGSGAFSGSVDVILSLRRPSGGGRSTIRELVAASRFDETPEKLLVEFADGSYVALGDEAAVESAEARSAVLELLEDEVKGMTLAALTSASGKSRQTLQRVVNDLVATHDLEVRGRGVKGDPHRFIRVDEEPGIRSAHTPTYYVGEVNGGAGQRTNPGEPTRWANPCHWYRDHQSKHRQTPSGWTCDACYPEEGPSA